LKKRNQRLKRQQQKRPLKIQIRRKQKLKLKANQPNWLKSNQAQNSQAKKRRKQLWLLYKLKYSN
jgi:hypothetical protein